MTSAFLKTERGNPENQDRGGIIEATSGLVLVVADGAQVLGTVEYADLGLVEPGHTP